jgi:Na+/alanine symporter
MDTSIVGNVINGEKISQFIQNNKMILLILIFIGWLVYTALMNKDRIDDFVEKNFK